MILDRAPGRSRAACRSVGGRSDRRERVCRSRSPRTRRPRTVEYSTSRARRSPSPSRCVRGRGTGPMSVVGGDSSLMSPPSHHSAPNVPLRRTVAGVVTGRPTEPESRRGPRGRAVRPVRAVLSADGVVVRRTIPKAAGAARLLVGTHWQSHGHRRLPDIAVFGLLSATRQPSKPGSCRSRLTARRHSLGSASAQPCYNG
jgi:hypothetical protein